MREEIANLAAFISKAVIIQRAVCELIKIIR